MLVLKCEVWIGTDKIKIVRDGDTIAEFTEDCAIGDALLNIFNCHCGFELPIVESESLNSCKCYKTAIDPEADAKGGA